MGRGGAWESLGSITDRPLLSTCALAAAADTCVLHDPGSDTPWRRSVRQMLLLPQMR